MRVSHYTKAFIVMLIIGMGFYFYNLHNTNHKMNTVYIPIWKNLSDIKLQDKKVDIAFIAFAKIDKNNIYFHEDPASNDQIKANIKKLKENHPQTRFVLAIGGYNVDGFSDASLDANRYQFTESIVGMVQELDLDGVDIDWEFPAFDAWGTQKARAEDTANFTYLMKELREKLNKLPHKNKKYVLTFAAGTQDWYFNNVEVKQVEKYVNFINVMSYDLTGRWSDTTGYNANLYKDANEKAKDSVDEIINMYLQHGIDSKKLLLGIPAYSYGWEGVKSEGGGNGAFAAGKPIDIDKVDLSYKTIEQKYRSKQGFKRYYDEKAKTAFLYDGDMFITYEDKEALKEKIAYIQGKDLGGAMVWEYSQDSEDGIVKFLGEHLNE
ncbi:glycosyl hydrolase family 18 protein [Paenibacillus profundus]|uniref:chitinase n=1 Tax=Paenibacillus profundus TaxID=1173085 RepID=A0ABS8YSJ0_9BACL|nr:glycosyl hydrolase family 18 protein [Paenibacillus profundus]MCE5173346.1 glycosyl hydrolase family 18 protein [Paenibacillus profundus]